MLTEEEIRKRKVNSQRVKECVANKKANMTEEQLNEYNTKKKEKDSNSAAKFKENKKAREQVAFETAVNVGAQALFDARDNDAFKAAVDAEALSLFDARDKVAFKAAVDAEAKALLV